MKYFAYGSNMSIKRLTERTPSVQRIGLFMLPDHQLKFHKAAADGSGKCDIYLTNNVNDIIYGALYEIDVSEKHVLDKIEGLGSGYEEKEVIVANENGDTYSALTYYATDIDNTLPPYSWYLNHVVTGAREINVPIDYLNNIKQTESIADPDPQRHSIEIAMYNQNNKDKS